MTLTEFLRLRITEDEEVARHAGDGGPVTHGLRSELVRAYDRDYGPVVGTVEIDSARLLAECEAKRRIMDVVGELGGHYEPNAARLSPSIIKLLALPYADHPDYREEWQI